LSDEVLVWLSVWSKVQIVCKAGATAIPNISCLIQIQTGFAFLVPAYPGGLGKDAIKWV